MRTRKASLRGERSLIQTIGRTARNINGRAILYADKATGSMDRALAETERRRTKQIAFNQANGITPQSIQKQVADIMEGARHQGPGTARKATRTRKRGAAPVELPEDPKALGKLVKQLETQMLEHAKNLEFEEAATVRDQIRNIREERLLA